MPADSVVIRLPGPRALRVLARSVLFAVALLSLPWLRTAEAPARGRTVDTCAAAAAQAELLLRDLHQEGLLVHGARAVVLGADGHCDPPTPKQDEDSVLRPVSLRRMLMIGDSSVDFLLDFGYFSEDADRFAFADRVLKHGGILAAPIDSLSAFSLPQNYRVIYIHRFSEAFVGVKKIAPADDNSHAGTRTELLSPPSLKEGVLYSQPAETTNGEFKNMARKLLLLSDITVISTAYKRKMLCRCSIGIRRVDSASSMECEKGCNLRRRFYGVKLLQLPSRAATTHQLWAEPTAYTENARYSLTKSVNQHE